MSDILEKLEAIKMRFDEVSQKIVDPDIIADMDRYVKLNKEYKELEEIVKAYKKYKNVLDNIETSKEMLSDPEMKEMAVKGDTVGFQIMLSLALYLTYTSFLISGTIILIDLISIVSPGFICFNCSVSSSEKLFPFSQKLLPLISMIH